MDIYKNIRNVCMNPVAVPRVTGSSLKIFRCGQCVNCLRQKANELAVRAYREFVGQDIAFLTFTYNDESCPIQVTDYDIDIETGEVTKEVSHIVRDPSFFDRAEFSVERNKKAYAKRFRPLIEFDSIEPLKYSHMSVRYPSVYYYDMKCLLKRFRERFPGALNQFICVPEYGGLGYRPHYHLLVYGLTDVHLNFLTKSWKKFGRVDIRFPDKSKKDECSKISMYISKYCTKGKFDCPYIRQGYCQKPRRSVSENFGVGNLEKLKRLVFATEVTGITDPWFSEDCPPDINEYVLSVLVQRRSLDLNGFPYPFPKYLLNKVAKTTVKVVDSKYLEYLYRFDISLYNQLKKKYGKRFIIPPDDKARGIPKKYKVVSSPLQTEVANYILRNLVRDALRKQRESSRFIKNSSDAMEDFLCEEYTIKSAKSALERQFLTDLYNNSYF